MPARAVALISALFIAVLALPAIARQTPGQKPAQPTFRVGVEYVEVDAVVHDKQGKFIADLTKDNFEIYEDGKRQQVDHMVLVNVPVDYQPMPALLSGRQFIPDVFSNLDPPGRVYLMVIDDLHVDPKRTQLARNLARSFILRNLAPNDVAAIALTSSTRTSAQEFTGSKSLLLQAVDKMVGRKTMARGLVEVGGGVSAADQERNATLYARERISNARSSLDALAQIARFAGTIHNRRKAIVFIGEGIDYAFGEQGFDYSNRPVEDQTAEGRTRPPQGLADEGSSSRALRDDLKLFLDAANRANVTLYALDPRVYTQGGDDMVDIASGAEPRFFDAAGNEVTTIGPVYDDLRNSQDNLRVMANETGGFAVTGSPKSVADAFARIRDENSRYYILAYYPTNDRKDGKFRKIEVRTNRPDTIVVARRGYVAPKNEKPTRPVPVETKEGTSAPLKEALAAALATPGLPIAVSAAPFRGPAGNASVLVMLQTPPGAVRFVQNEGKLQGKLEVAFVAMDYQNKTRGGEHLELDMPLKPQMADVVNRVGLLVQSRLSLPPGRYILRIGARDGNSERVGAVHCDLEIPDYAKGSIGMSGLVLSSAQTVLANPRPDKELPSQLPGSPIVIRNVPQSDEISLLAEIYDAKLATPHDVDIVTTVVGEDGREAYRHDDRRSTQEMQAASGGFGYLLTIPVSSIAPGSYVLRVEARSRLDANNPVAREAMFTVMK